MDHFIESNERTLVMFDAACSGLASCLALVHADIKQMTEHRNRLASQLEEEMQKAKRVKSTESEGDVTDRSDESFHEAERRPSVNSNSAAGGRGPLGCKNNNYHQPNHKSTSQISETNLDEERSPSRSSVYLEELKLLDKRLVDSFSQALSISDIQKSSLAAKNHSSGNNRASIFQVLLGKSGKSTNSLARRRSSETRQANGIANDTLNGEAKVDNRILIDDINRQTRLAMQYSKQLEAHLFKVEDLRSRYEMHLKMGLVVKSVARVYLNNNSSSPNSLKKKRNNTLVMNESTPNVVHSSMSSLESSTWSSKHRARQRQQQQQQHQHNLQIQQQQQQQQQLATGANQMFVSTISLNNEPSKRLSLSRLISRKRHSAQYSDQQALGTLQRRSAQPSQQYGHHGVVASHCEPFGLLECGVYDPYSYATDCKNLNTVSRSSVNLTSERSRGFKAKDSSAATKTTIKEFVENIDKIETEFESYLGSFLIAIDSIQGFARVCQGDVFEIAIKYGESHKFKTRVSVLKDSRQRCDNRQTVFKARIADALAIKAYECKGLGKRVLLGHKLCETRDLFTERSQLMTISLNQTGSIKLNLIVTWNPLHMAPTSTSAMPGLDISHISLPATPVSSSTLSSLSSMPSLTGTATTTIRIQSQSRNSNGSPVDEHRSYDNHNKYQIQNNMITYSSPPSPDYLQSSNLPRRIIVTHGDKSPYQTVDPTYGYYIPPPDYIGEDVICREC